MKTNNADANNAIDRSISHDEIVVLQYSDHLFASLKVASEDFVVICSPGCEIDMWGERHNDGGAWRVALKNCPDLTLGCSVLIRRGDGASDDEELGRFARESDAVRAGVERLVDHDLEWLAVEYVDGEGVAHVVVENVVER